MRALVAEFGLGGRVELFRAEHAGFTPAPEALARWWDLDAIAAGYRAYLGAWRPPLLPLAPPAGRSTRRRRSLATCASSTRGGASPFTTRACRPPPCRPTGRATT